MTFHTPLDLQPRALRTLRHHPRHVHVLSPLAMSLCWQYLCKHAWELYKDYPRGAYDTSFTPYSLQTRALPVPRAPSQVGSISSTTPLIFSAD